MVKSLKSLYHPSLHYGSQRITLDLCQFKGKGQLSISLPLTFFVVKSGAWSDLFFYECRSARIDTVYITKMVAKWPKSFTNLNMQYNIPLPRNLAPHHNLILGWNITRTKSAKNLFETSDKIIETGGIFLQVPITPKNDFRLIKTLYETRENDAEMF